jgi:prepilin-type N-terminal cleavage/methylation domain-containing protein
MMLGGRLSADPPAVRAPQPDATDASGFTLLELLIAMSLIIIAVIPLTNVIWSGLRTSATSSHRTDAFAIAARETESLHADPYALVGFYSDQVAIPWRSNPTVLIGSCSTSCLQPFAPLILQAATAAIAGVTYSIARYVYWAEAQGVNNGSTSTTFAQAYKATTITVSWIDVTGHHSLQQDSIVYPGGLGLYSGPGGSSAPTTSTTAPPLAPGPPSITVADVQPPSPQDQQEIDLSIVAPTGGGAVAAYFVQWSTDLIFPAPAQSPQLPPTSTSYAVQGLATGTTYFLRIFAGNATGQSAYSSVVSASTAPAVAVTTTTAPLVTLPPVTIPPLTLPPVTLPPVTLPPVTTTTVPPTTTTTVPCTLGAFTITTSTTGKTYLNKSGTMSENVILNLTVNAPCPWLASVVSVLHGTLTADPASPYVLFGLPTGGQWSATISSSGQSGWSVGTHDMTIVLVGRTTAVSHGLLICAWKPPGQRSASSTTC